MNDAGNILDIDGTSLGVVGLILLSDKFSVFGKAGVHFWDTEICGPVANQALTSLTTSRNVKI